MIKSMKFEFQNNNGQTLAGRLELPSIKPKGFALFAHCFTCSKNFIASKHIAQTMAQHGYGTLRFDFTGLGNSEGDFANTNFSTNLDDLVSAYKALEDKYEAPSILIGHSLGGAAVLELSKRLEKVKAVITLCAPSDTEHVSHLFKDHVEEIEANGEAQVVLAGRDFKIKKQFIEDIKSQQVLDGLDKTKMSYLIMHSPVDNTVSIDHAGEIYKSIRHPKSFISLNQADHLLTNKEDINFATTIISSWLDGQKDLQQNIETKAPFEGDQILVETRDGHNFTQDIYSRHHYLVADEPKSIKGDNFGMNPYELLLSALGACTAMTMRMYARRKKFDLQKVKVSLSHKKDYHEDCQTCDTTKPTVDIINKTIEVEGNLSEEEKEKIFAISEKCPVHRTITSEIIIEEKFL